MKKLILILASFLLALLLAPCVLAKGDIPVSTGLAVLAGGTDMAKTALVGENISFTREDFCRALNMKKAPDISITKLPDDSTGTLYLGSEKLNAGVSVKGERLDTLTFIPKDKSVREGFFEFSTGGGYSIKCNLYFIEKVNYSPTVSLAAEYTLSAQTHARVSRVASLDAYDPEGDKFIFEVVSYPENGALVLLDRDSGRYVYTPKGDFTGSDSFSYVARDIYGNYSSAASVTLTVKPRETSVSIGDITDCNTYNAALTMLENSLMGVEERDGAVCFSPNDTISRAEFLATAMRAAGMTDPGNGTATVFADDEDIPEMYRGYVSAAYQLGYINGTEIDGDIYFLPSSTVTRAEAAVMVNGMLARSVKTEKSVIQPVFADSGDLPAWARDAVYNLDSMGILTAVSGYASPDETVSRGLAAQMLEAVMKTLE